MMAQQHTPAAGSGTAAVALSDVKLALLTARMRRNSGGQVCQIAAVTAGTTIAVDCSTPGRLRMRADAMRMGKSRVTASPLDRGHIAYLIERVRWQHGLGEVRKTWGVGIKALRAEPRYVLNGGSFQGGK